MIRPEDIIISKDLVKTSARNFLRIKIVNVTKPIGATGMIRVHMLLEEKLRLLPKLPTRRDQNLGSKMAIWYMLYLRHHPRRLSEKEIRIESIPAPCKFEHIMRFPIRTDISVC